MSVPIDFFECDVVSLAKKLLGTFLVHETQEGITIGKIVETEAYRQDDPASHTFGGKTTRNQAMFGKPGHAYIYFTYGMHYCFNVTAEKEKIGAGVLIRALEPVERLDLMHKRRLNKFHAKNNSLLQTNNSGLSTRDYCSGPGKLVIAMGIIKEMYGHDLRQKPLYLVLRDSIDVSIIETTRIGISQGVEKKWRFYIKDNPYVSKK